MATAPGPSLGPMTTFPAPAASRLAESGPVLFARYAFGPNRAGLCGPDDWRALLELGSSGVDDRGLRQLAEGFDGAYPYLVLLAREAGLRDPLDRRVVEAYWLGGQLVDRTGPAALTESVTERFRPRVGRAEWPWLLGSLDAGALPVHAFHVLSVFPRIGLLRGGDPGDAVELMSACLIRWGRVVEVGPAQLIVEASALEFGVGKLRFGSPRLQVLQRAVDGTAFRGDPRPGDVVSIHWGWACDRLDPMQAARLRRVTLRQLAVANRTI
jgi:Family of unknown function (DUF6390)